MIIFLHACACLYIPCLMSCLVVLRNSTLTEDLHHTSSVCTSYSITATIKMKYITL